MSLFIFTRQEQQVILFLLFVALLGLGINFLTKHYSKIRVIGYVTEDFKKVNLNHAIKEDFIAVPGIGEKLAQRIIEYRRENGQFKNIYELNNIKGVGKFKFEKIKDYFEIKKNQPK